MMGWPTEKLRKIARADDFHIVPFRKDGVTYSAPTWTFSAVDEALYARGFNGPRSNWDHDAGAAPCRSNHRGISMHRRQATNG